LTVVERLTKCLKGMADDSHNPYLRSKDAHATAVAADLEQLAALRKYLLFERKAGVSADGLIKAIDDFAEKLTGDRRALHAQHHTLEERVEIHEWPSLCRPE
jgi:hypothetical protein